MPNDVEDEVVEDSEPERLERRRKLKLEKKLKNLSKTADIATANNRPEAANPEQLHVIDLTNTAEIPDSAGREDMGRIPKFGGDIFPSVSAPRRNVPATKSSSAALPAQISPSLADSHDSQVESQHNRLNLERFAHRPDVRPFASAPDASRNSEKLPSLSATISYLRPSERKKSRIISDLCMNDVTLSDLEKLRKCVICDTAWTVKKGAAQKLAHIQACAKMKGITGATMQELIRREIDAAHVDERVKAKVIEDGRTLMEDVLKGRGAATSKQASRKKAVGTVKSLSETRHLILDKARTILENLPMPTSGESSPPVSQTFGTSALEQAIAHRQTAPRSQLLGRSTMGLNLVQSGRTSIAQYREPYLAAEPSTSATRDDPPSHPATEGDSNSPVSSSHSEVAESYENEIVLASVMVSNPQEVKDETPSLQNPVLSAFSMHGLANSLPSISGHAPRYSLKSMSDWSVEVLQNPPKNYSPSPHQNPTEPCNYKAPHVDNYRADYTHYNDDEEYLHFSPNKNILSCRHLESAHSYSSSEETPVMKMLQAKECEQARPPMLKEKTVKYAEPDDGEWEEQLKDAIIRDTSLYLRILRYEPIDLDVFLRLANELNMQLTPQKLKQKVIRLLDKFAITFIGSAIEFKYTSLGDAFYSSLVLYPDF